MVARFTARLTRFQQLEQGGTQFYTRAGRFAATHGGSHLTAARDQEQTKDGEEHDDVAAEN